jgi:hypothetical protein
MRFKYSPFSIDDWAIKFNIESRILLTDDHHLVKDLPKKEGEYLLRHDVPCTYSELIRYNKRWYLVRTLKDTYTYDTIPFYYNLMPNLKESEWQQIIKHKDKLNKYWKRMVVSKEREIINKEINQNVKKLVINVIS